MIEEIIKRLSKKKVTKEIILNKNEYYYVNDDIQMEIDNLEDGTIKCILSRYGTYERGNKLLHNNNMYIEDGAIYIEDETTEDREELQKLERYKIEARGYSQGEYEEFFIVCKRGTKKEEIQWLLAVLEQYYTRTQRNIEIKTTTTFDFFGYKKLEERQEDEFCITTEDARINQDTQKELMKEYGTNIFTYI